ncbi:MAG: hypothetical protein ACOCWQ_05330, partial [Nanoarchaeota archaeon]
HVVSTVTVLDENDTMHITQIDPTNEPHGSDDTGTFKLPAYMENHPLRLAEEAFSRFQYKQGMNHVRKALTDSRYCNKASEMGYRAIDTQLKYTLSGPDFDSLYDDLKEVTRHDDRHAQHLANASLYILDKKTMFSKGRPHSFYLEQFERNAPEAAEHDRNFSKILAYYYLSRNIPVSDVQESHQCLDTHKEFIGDFLYSAAKGRLYQRSGDIGRARKYFQKAYEQPQTKLHDRVRSILDQLPNEE